MLSIYLIICLVGVILLIIFAALGGFGADVEAADADIDFDVGGGDVDVDVDVGVDVDTDIDVDVGGDVGLDVGDADIDAGMDVHLSPISLPILLIFVTSFGAFGMIMEAFYLYWLYIPFISTAFGVLVATVMFFIMLKVFAATQSTSLVPLRKLIGNKGTISIAIKHGQEGQVVVIRPEKGRMLIGAVADEEIPVDSEVVVVEVLKDILKVQKLEAKPKTEKQAVMK